MQHLVQVILLTELVGEGQAGEMLDPVPVDGVHIEPDSQGGKKPCEHHQGDDDHDPLAVLVHGAEGDVGEEGKGQQEATEEAKYMCNVVYPGQETTNKEKEDNPREVQKSFPRLLQDLPALEELYEEAS